MEPDLLATLAGFQPRLRYLLLDEGRIANHPDPSLRNLASALFRLEFSFAPEDFRAVWDRLFDWISHPNKDSLRRAFITWANRIRPAPSPAWRGDDQIKTLKDVSDFLDSRDWSKEWKSSR